MTPDSSGAVSADKPWVGLSLSGAKSLRPDNAVAALLVTEDGRYVMQLRDLIPNIFFPGHWGCFGGGVVPGESPVEALKRELSEEIEFVPDGVSEFTRFDFDFSRLGHSAVYRIYFVVRITENIMNKFILHEGSRLAAFTGEELLDSCRVTPYDAVAIWMHMSAQRFNSA
ncbi:MAG: NUDIX domain-containing protein [Gemmatimonadaceae bacterium]|nr:NUDIX domain-containing protein [Gemmatimonadaceae bacterium]MBA3655768.1 NUDIX domain-containing protein [Gemmatimonadaceae bacterium]